MMVWADIAGRITAGEGLTTEFKRTLEFRRLGRAVCGFANTSGGVAVLGVDDGGGTVGVAGNPESTRERLANFLQNGCNAPLHGTCGSQELDAGWVHWVEVPRQRGFEPMRYDGRVWVRRDRITAEPSPTELQELYNAFGYVLTEEQAITAADPDDIDLKVFRGHLANQGLDLNDPQPTEEDDLQNLGVTTEFDGKVCPTLFGLMAFGKQPRTFAPTANFWIDCVAYAGTDQGADAIRAGEATGRLGEQVRYALGWARGLGHYEKFEGPIRQDIPLLPLVAMREALVNAVVHRDYANIGSKVLLEVFTDRIEITSPGTLPNHLTVAAVCRGGRTRSRNEQMANYMLERRFMEKPGRGWLVMRKAMREFNGAEPGLGEDARSRFVTVTLPLARP